MREERNPGSQHLGTTPIDD